MANMYQLNSLKSAFLRDGFTEVYVAKNKETSKFRCLIPGFNRWYDTVEEVVEHNAFSLHEVTLKNNVKEADANYNEVNEYDFLLINLK